MRANTNVVWNAFEQRRNMLAALLREKRIVLMDDDMRKASRELRSLYPTIDAVKSELNVLRRVIAKQDSFDDGSGDERRTQVERHYVAIKRESAAALTEPATGDVLKLRGYAVLWNELSEDLGGFREKFVRSAFTDTLRDDEQEFLIEHLPPPIASTNDGTLTLEANTDGLHFEARLDKRDPMILRAEPLLRARRAMSFAFVAKRDRWQEIDGETIRTVLTAKLLEISAVKAPAYPQSNMYVSTRSQWRAAAEARSRHLRLMAMK